MLATPRTLTLPMPRTPAHRPAAGRVRQHPRRCGMGCDAVSEGARGRRRTAGLEPQPPMALWLRKGQIRGWTCDGPLQWFEPPRSRGGGGSEGIHGGAERRSGGDEIVTARDSAGGLPALGASVVRAAQQLRHPHRASGGRGGLFLLGGHHCRLRRAGSRIMPWLLVRMLRALRHDG